ncbi:MAG: MFS transporter [Chloroflexi bacterium]|nr:MFS transporter [Chloroflexota bacterium]
MLSGLALSPRYKWYAFAVIAVGTFSSVVDHGSVSVALPSIATDFNSDIPTVQWVVIGFALTISALLLPMGRLADLIGLKKVYIVGSLILILGAVLAGTSTSAVVLIASRVVQGAGAAMTQGTGMAIVIAAFPAAERGKAIGLIMTMVGTGAIAGPAVGGFLVQTLGWPSVFFANIPLVAVGVVAGMVVLQGRSRDDPRSEPAPHGFDWLGALLSSGALLIFLVAISNAHRAGWLSPPILASGATFVVLMVAFVWWERRVSSPMLDMRFFQSRVFSLGVSAAFLTFLGSSAVLFMTPFYLQSVLGYGANVSGLVVVPGAICMAILGVFSGRWSDRYGARPFAVGGLLLSATGILIMSRLTETSSIFMVIPALVLLSSGMGVFYSPNASAVLGAVGRDRYGVVSAFLNLVRNAGNVTSVAMATAIVTATMGSMGYEPSLDAVRASADTGVAQAFVAGLRYAYLAMAGSVLLAMTVSLVKAPTPQLAEPVVTH